MYTYEHRGTQLTLTGMAWLGAVYDRNGKEVCEVLNYCIGGDNVYLSDDLESFKTFTETAIKECNTAPNPLDEYVVRLCEDNTETPTTPNNTEKE